MASLTPTINYTPYDIQRIEGMLDFDIVDDKVYFISHYPNNPTALKKMHITSPQVEESGIILESIKFKNVEETSSSYDTLYYSRLNYKYYDNDTETTNTFTINMPRTMYMEKSLTRTSQVQEQNILIFTNPIISNVLYNSELDVRAFDSNGLPIEILNISVADNTCTVTLPPLSDNQIRGVCRVYVYNTYMNTLEYNENYTAGSSYNLMPMNYILWTNTVLTTLINLTTTNDSNTDHILLAHKLENNLTDIINTIYEYMGDIVAIGLYTEYIIDSTLVINVTSLSASTPYQVASMDSKTTITEGYSYYSVSNIVVKNPAKSVKITLSVDSDTISYEYNDEERVANKIGYGIVNDGQNTYTIEDSCNLGTHLM